MLRCSEGMRKFFKSFVFRLFEVVEKATTIESAKGFMHGSSDFLTARRLDLGTAAFGEWLWPFVSARVFQIPIVFTQAPFLSLLPATPSTALLLLWSR